MRKFCETELKLSDSLIKNKPTEKLLDDKIDDKLSFYIHHKIICEKANTRLMELTKATPYMNTEKWRIKLSASLNTQFHYCPQIWVLHSRCSNNKINTYMKDFSNISTMASTLYTKNFSKKMSG